MTITTAQRQLRHIVHLRFERPSPARLEDLRRLLEQVTPQVQLLEPDSAVLDVTGALRIWNRDAAEIARLIQLRAAALVVVTARRSPEWKTVCAHRSCESSKNARSTGGPPARPSRCGNAQRSVRGAQADHPARGGASLPRRRAIRAERAIRPGAPEPPGSLPVVLRCAPFSHDGTAPSVRRSAPTFLHDSGFGYFRGDCFRNILVCAHMLLLRSTGFCTRTAGRCPPYTPCTTSNRPPGGSGRRWSPRARAACASPLTRRSAGHSRTSPRSLGARTSTGLELDRGAQLRLQAAQTPRILKRAATEEGIRHSGPPVGLQSRGLSVPAPGQA